MYNARVPRGSRKASRIILIALVLAVLAAGGWVALAILRPQVQITDVVQGPVVEAFYATGTISAEHEYPIRATTSGILKLVVDKGSLVKAGQILATVENSDLQYAVDQSQAELDRRQKLADDATSPVLAELRAKLQADEAMLAIAKSEEDRVKRLQGGGASSQTDLENATNRVQQVWMERESIKQQIEARKIDLKHDVDVAVAALKSAQWNLDQANLRSPIDGTVLDWPTSTGTRVAVNDHIMQVADVSFDHLVMRSQVDEEDKNKLRPPNGDNRQQVRMTLYAYPGEVLSGMVDRIYDKADADRRTYEVDVKMDHPDKRLSAGMTGELNFIVETRAIALVVPTQAVQGGQVLVVKDGRLEKPAITTGLKSIERTEITSGLRLGDQVVISPQGDLAPGQRVRVVRIDAVAAAEINRPPEVDAFHGFNP